MGTPEQLAREEICMIAFRRRRRAQDGAGHRGGLGHDSGPHL